MKTSFRAALFAALWSTAALAAAPELKYVVIVTRHGVRSPTWDAARLNRYSAQPWPDWGVPPGDLTPHGRELIKLLGNYYRSWFAKEHLLHGRGCSDKGRIYIWADSDQRTLETGRAFAESLLPGCGLAIHSRPDRETDPLFSGVKSADPVRAAEAVRERLGSDPQALLAEHRAALDTLQFILTGGQPAAKKLIEPPERIAPVAEGRTIELQGPFTPASTLSEDLLLEYAERMQGSRLGWGRLTKDNLYSILELHRVYADVMRRTPYLAAERGSNLLAHVLASLAQAVSGTPAPGALGPPGSALVILSGHDTNLSNLSGMLNLSWNLHGYQPDETPPGGALIFSLWRDPASGHMSVQARYLAATLDQMRSADAFTLAHPPPSQALSLPGCPATCSWQDFERAARRAIHPSQIDFDLH
ncbi:MAG TPA: histidine-type phosphatase [Bryobacteraceae bacterium]|nr:histidine-type phosphatase [Bryobacteraceae bacterium]